MELLDPTLLTQDYYIFSLLVLHALYAFIADLSGQRKDCINGFDKNPGTVKRNAQQNQVSVENKSKEVECIGMMFRYFPLWFDCKSSRLAVFVYCF